MSKVNDLTEKISLSCLALNKLDGTMYNRLLIGLKSTVLTRAKPKPCSQWCQAFAICTVIPNTHYESNTLTIGPNANQRKTKSQHALIILNLYLLNDLSWSCYETEETFTTTPDVPSSINPVIANLSLLSVL